MITLEALNQQIELQAMYRDDKFAGLLGELRVQYKQTQDAQKALDQDRNDLKAREKLCDVIQNSQAEFNAEKQKIETHNATVSKRNQKVRDELSAQTISVARTVDEAKRMTADAETLMRSAKSKHGLAESRLRKAEDALAGAEEKQAKWETRLLEIGLKPAA